MNPESETIILDSFAMLAYLEGEEGEERVKEIFRNAENVSQRVLMSMINWGEVIYITERERGLAKAQEAIALMEQLPIELCPVDRQTVLDAANIKANYALAYADAFAVVLAKKHDGFLLTGGPEYEQVQGIMKVEWLGERTR